MDDSIKIGAFLQSLDELDVTHYTSKSSVSKVDITKMAATEDLHLDSNNSDFDHSDEDLASLLADDDEDIFAKKIFGNSPIKTSTPNGSAVVAKTNIESKISSPSHSFGSPQQKTGNSKVKGSSKDDFDDDILNDLLESSGSKSASVDVKYAPSEKDKTRKSSLYNEENDFLDDFDLNQVSPTKDSLSSNKRKKSISTDKKSEKSSDILDEFNVSDKTTSKTSKERRGSFFDDFLQTLSPKKGEKKTITKSISEEKQINNDDTEEDILGTYIPTAPKINETISDVTKSPKRRGSLLKQVSFKEVSEDFLDTDLSPTKSFASPAKETTFQLSTTEKRTESKIQSKRSEKTGANKSEDMDWLNFFKDSPKKKSQVPEAKKKDPDLPVGNKPKPSMKRQSSADWLGLDDSKTLGEEESIEDKEDTLTVKNSDFSRPNTANLPASRSRKQDLSKTLDSWKDDEDFLRSSNQPPISDLSKILKTVEPKSPEKKYESESAFVKDVFESKAIDTSVTAKTQIPKGKSKLLKPNDEVLTHVISDTAMLSKDSAPIAKHDVQMVNLKQNFEFTSALQSMQLMLDDSVKERNKLIKENETLRTMFEEKLKGSEEFHKSEKRMLEDAIKTVESSLKQEFEIKLKSLEERLNLVTEEKEKQVKSFNEKLQNILKEHETEMKRIKELHNQSITVMKEDHEEALSRLKKLKEQEIEAVLSTQVHSKSLQYLSDQLEARANELASLQNKIEERSQTSLKEKEAMLEVKEKDLKALQSRLQRQLEDSEEERSRLQQLVLRLEGRLQKTTVEGEQDHWDVQQMKAKLTVQQKYLEEEQKLNQFQIEREKEKLRISQDSLLQEQKTVLLQLAQERQQLTQEKLDVQSLVKRIKEEEAKLNVKILKEESTIEAEKQYLQEEKNKLHFEKEKVKHELYELERKQDSLQREKQQFKNEREALHELEIQIKRKSAEIEEMKIVAAQEQDKGQREYAAAQAIKREQELKMQQYTQQMQVLMDKERHILSEREKLIAEKIEFEQNKNSVLCTKCRLSLDNPIQAPPTELKTPVVLPLPNINGLSSQLQSSFADPNLVIWHITAQKDRDFLREELAFLKSLKESSRRKLSK